MPRTFNIVGQIQLRGPANLRPVVSNIRRQLQGINANIRIGIPTNANRNIQATHQSVTRLASALAQVQVNAAGATTQIQRLGSALQPTTTTMQTLNKNSAAVNNNMRKTSRQFSNAKTQIEEFGRVSALAVRRFLAFSIPAGAVISLVTAIKSGVQEAVSFERELIKISQVTRTSVADLKLLTNEISRLSIDLGVSSSELLEVSRIISQTGLSARDTQTALEALAKSSLAPTFTDIKSTTEGAIAAMAQFGKEAKDLDGILGSINAVAGQFAVESDDIIFALRRTGGAFQAAGGSLNELIGLFTAVRSTTRESAETIATGFRTIFTRLQRGSTIQFLERLGIQLRDVNNQFVGPFEAIQRIATALRSLPSTDPLFAKIVEELGGFRQVSKVIPLIQQATKAQDAFRVAVSGTNSLSEDANKAQQALAIRITKVREEFLKLFRDISNNKAFKDLVDITLSLASNFIKIASTIEPLIPLLGAFAGFKAASFVTQFGSGFIGGLRNRTVGGASVRTAGAAVAGVATGAAGRSASTAAITLNTTSLQANTTAIAALTGAIAASRASGVLGGGRRRGFAQGGLIPGVGNQDSFPALLTPGEFVLNKEAVKAIGQEDLFATNKFARGSRGRILRKKGDVSRKRRLAVDAEGNPTPQARFLAAKRNERFARRFGSDVGIGEAFLSRLITSGKLTAGGQKLVNKIINSPHRTDIFSSIPAGSQYIDSGNEAIVFKTPVGEALRLSRTGVRGFTGDRPNISRVVQPFATRKFGDVTVERLPFQDTIESLSRKRTRNIDEQLKFETRIKRALLKRIGPEAAAQGLEPIPSEFGAFNLGRSKSGKITILDPNVFKRFQDGGKVLDFDRFKLVNKKKTLSQKNTLQQVTKDIDQLQKNSLFGAIYLRPGGISRDFTGTTQQVLGKSKDKAAIRFRLLTRSPSKKLSDNFIDNAKANVNAAMINGVNSLGQTLGTNVNSPGLVNKLLKQVGFDNILGRLFEGSLSLIGTKSVFGREPGSNFDFPKSIEPRIGRIFGLSSGFPVEAKSTFNRKNNLSVIDKIRKHVQQTASTLGFKSTVPPSQLLGTVATAVREQLQSGKHKKSILDDIRIAQGGAGKGLKAQTFFESFGIKSRPQLNAAIEADPELRSIFLKKADGGTIPGFGNSDTVPALLTPGEFVVRKQAVDAIGLGTLQRINQMGGTGKIERRRLGGSIPRFQRGTGISRAELDAFRSAKTRAQLINPGLQVATAHQIFQAVQKDGTIFARVLQQYTSVLDSQATRLRQAPLDKALQGMISNAQRAVAAAAGQPGSPVLGPPAPTRRQRRDINRANRGSRSSVGGGSGLALLGLATILPGLLPDSTQARTSRDAQIAGGAQGVVGGALAGSFIGGSIPVPGATIAGAAIGGIIGGLKGASDSLADFEKAVRANNVASSIEDFNKALQSLVQNTNATSDDIIKQINVSASLSGLTRGKGLLNERSTGLGLIGPSVRTVDPNTGLAEDKLSKGSRFLTQALALFTLPFGGILPASFAKPGTDRTERTNKVFGEIFSGAKIGGVFSGLFKTQEERQKDILAASRSDILESIGTELELAGGRERAASFLTGIEEALRKGESLESIKSKIDPSVLRTIGLAAVRPSDVLGDKPKSREIFDAGERILGVTRDRARAEKAAVAETERMKAAIIASFEATAAFNVAAEDFRLHVFAMQDAMQNLSNQVLSSQRDITAASALGDKVTFGRFDTSRALSLESRTVNPEGATDLIRTIGRRFGREGTAAARLGVGAVNVQSRLRDALVSASRAKIDVTKGGEDFAEFLRTALTRGIKPGSFGAAAEEKLIDGIAESLRSLDPKQAEAVLTELLKGNFQGVADRFGEPVNKLIEVFGQAAENMDKIRAELLSNLETLRRFDAAILERRLQTPDIRQSIDSFRLDRRRARFGVESVSFGDSARAATKAFGERQRILTEGLGLRNIFDPTEIRESILINEDRQKELERERARLSTRSRITGAGTLAQEQQIGAVATEQSQLATETKRLQQAFENLGRESGILAAAQQRISQLENARQARFSIAERIATADPKELQKIRAELRAAEFVSKQGGSFAGLNLDARRLAISGLKSTGSNIFGSTGQSGTQALSNALSELLKNTGLSSSKIVGTIQNQKVLPPFFANAGIKADTELRQLENLIVADKQRQISVNDEMVKLLQTQRGVFQKISDIQTTNLTAKTMSILGGVTKKAAGGTVPGTGSGDTVPAMLTPGEFVINKKAASQIGLSNLTALNRGETVGFNKGGPVQHFQFGGRVGKELENIRNQRDIDERAFYAKHGLALHTGYNFYKLGDKAWFDALQPKQKSALLAHYGNEKDIFKELNEKHLFSTLAAKSLGSNNDVKINRTAMDLEDFTNISLKGIKLPTVAIEYDMPKVYSDALEKHKFNPNAALLSLVDIKSIVDSVHKNNPKIPPYDDIPENIRRKLIIEFFAANLVPSAPPRGTIGNQPGFLGGIATGSLRDFQQQDVAQAKVNVKKAGKNFSQQHLLSSLAKGAQLSALKISLKAAQAAGFQPTIDLISQQIARIETSTDPSAPRTIGSSNVFTATQIGRFARNTLDESVKNYPNKKSLIIERLLKQRFGDTTTLRGVRDSFIQDPEIGFRILNKELHAAAISLNRAAIDNRYRAPSVTPGNILDLTRLHDKEIASVLASEGSGDSPLMRLLFPSELLQQHRKIVNAAKRVQGHNKPVPFFAEGGPVPGVGSGDTVPAMLTPGEFVIRKSAAEAIGFNNLSLLNNAQGFQFGGAVGRGGSGSVFSTEFPSSIPLEMDANGLNALERFGGNVNLFSNGMTQFATNISNFGLHIQTLTQSINNIPQSIDLNATHNVLVNVAGVDQLEPLIRSIVLDAVENSIGSGRIREGFEGESRLDFLRA